MISDFLIYALCDPRDGQLRYVGLSSYGLARPMSHWTTKLRDTKDHCHNWIRSVLNDGFVPEIEVLEEFQSRDGLSEAEKFWISYFRFIGCRLTNMTDGGSGMLGMKAWNRGKKWSEEIRQKMRKPKVRIAPARHGYHLSDEHRAAISRATSGIIRSDSFKEKQSQRMKREWDTGVRPVRKWTEEQKAEQRIRIKKWWDERKVK